MSTSHNRSRLAKHTIRNLALMFIGGSILNAALATADGQRSTQSVVGSDIIMPYDGYLMVDAAPLTGTRTIKFDLYQSSAGGSPVWSEAQAVNLYNGRFSVGLGSSTSLTDTILDAEKLFLSMTIVETDAQGNIVEIPLAGRQSIEPAPFAAWAANSADKQVAGDLEVEGGATVYGTLTSAGLLNASNALTASGGATIRGDDSNGSTAALEIGRDDGQGGMIIIDDDEIDSTGNGMAINRNSGHSVDIGGTLITRGDHSAYGKYLPKYSNWNGNVGDGDASIVNDNGSHKALMIHGNKSANGSTRVVRLWDKLDVRGELITAGNTTLGDAASDSTTVAGDLTVNGNLKSWPEGHYCIVQSARGGCVGGSAQCSNNNSNCPSGFTSASAAWDTDNNDSLTTSQINGNTSLFINGNNAGMQIYFCCK